MTLWFHAGERGAAEVVARRAGKVVVKHRVLVQPGGRHVLFTVSAQRPLRRDPHAREAHASLERHGLTRRTALD